MHTPEQAFFAVMAKAVLEALEKRNIEGFYADTKEEALRIALDMIPQDAVVSNGGSETLEALGFRQALTEKGCTYLDPNAVQGGERMAEVARQALGADCYLMSANAIAATGEIVNADGIGNRVAALCFGPKQVMILAGMNKVVPTLEAAIERVKTVAAPHSVLKYFPDRCTTLPALYAAAEAACNQVVITRGSTFTGRIKVILIGEHLGY